MRWSRDPYTVISVGTTLGRHGLMMPNACDQTICRRPFAAFIEIRVIRRSSVTDVSTRVHSESIVAIPNHGRVAIQFQGHVAGMPGSVIDVAWVAAPGQTVASMRGTPPI